MWAAFSSPDSGAHRALQWQASSGPSTGLFRRFQGMAATLKGCTPSFEYRLWTDEQNEALMMEHYSFFQ